MSARRSSANVAIWWIRRDLRLHDNDALTRALDAAERVIPVFVCDPALRARPAHARAARRQAFLFAGLRALDADLTARGAGLIVRSGDPCTVLHELVEQTGATMVIAERDVSPYAHRRDARVRRHVPLELVPGVTVHDPRSVRKADGTPYTVFTAFARAWASQPMPTRRDILSAPRSLPALPAGLRSEPLPIDAEPLHFPAGEAAARARVRAFVHGTEAPIHAYASARDRVDHDGTSALSPYLRFGMLSARTAVVAACEAGGRLTQRPLPNGASVWLSELVWREFYLAILGAFPSVLGHAFNARLRHVAWRDAPDDLAAWQHGRTGYPIVDAAMRQLTTTGWMHNRARMIVASFLTKDLLLDWRAGEAWFMEQLVDGDPAANNGGWQWTAGTGTDAAPYFRVFNPVRQAERFDPDGTYVRRWVPELAGLPAPGIHAPWTVPPLALHAAGVTLGTTYPRPIVEHAAARTRAVAAYKNAGV